MEEKKGKVERKVLEGDVLPPEEVAPSPDVGADVKGPVPEESRHVIIITATQDEYQAALAVSSKFKPGFVEVAMVGIGPSCLANLKSDIVPNQKGTLAVNFGTCRALYGNLPVGAVVSSVGICDKDFVKNKYFIQTARVLNPHLLGVFPARMASGSIFLCGSGEGILPPFADTYDMETEYLYKFFASRGFDFLSIRAVSDSVHSISYAENDYAQNSQKVSYSAIPVLEEVVVKYLEGKI